MTRFTFLLILFVSTAFAQNRYKTNSFNWITGVDEKFEDRNTSLSIGFSTNFGKVTYKKASNFGQDVFIPEFVISYNDFYTFTKNNPHNFISYNGLKAFVGDIHTQELNGKLNPEGMRFGIGLTKGFGYNLDFMKIIPFNRSSKIWQKYEFEDKSLDVINSDIKSQTYSGKNRETGVMFIFDYGFEIDLSHSHTSFIGESNFGKSLASSALEFGSSRLLSYGLQEWFSDSKWFPIIDYVAELALRTLFISLRRDQYFFPFSGKEDFTISTFNVGIKKSFNINLF